MKLEEMAHVIERLLARAEAVTESGCWLWLGSVNNDGYGLIRIGSRRDGSRRLVKAHRLSYEVHVGPIPLGLEVLHRCDVPACVNPAHLFVGTHLDNVNDMLTKGRHHHKLSIEARREIATSTEPSLVLAHRHGVCRRLVFRIRREAQR